MFQSKLTVRIEDNATPLNNKQIDVHAMIYRVVRLLRVRYATGCATIRLAETVRNFYGNLWNVDTLLHLHKKKKKNIVRVLRMRAIVYSYK